jgi:lysophospholipase L1-like esterase
MANLDPDAVLTPELKKHFGPENVIVVKVAQKGQPIRRWFKGWKVTGDQNPDQIGDIYERLMKETKTALGARPIQSAILVWMQGERDAKERLSDQYEEAFRGLLEQIKADLKLAELNHVIGRLSDSGLGKSDWDKIRAIQQKLGEAGPHAAWVNTDDLNDGASGKGDDLHYTKAGYDLLAKRYVEKIKELVK